MATEYEGILPQGTTVVFDDAVFAAEDFCLVTATLARMTKAKIVRPCLANGVDSDEEYRNGAQIKYGDMSLVVVYDPDVDYKALMAEGNNDKVTFTLPKKDADNGTAGTVGYNDAFLYDVGEPVFDYNNDTAQVTIELIFGVSGYFQTDEAA